MITITYHTRKGGVGKSVLSVHHAWYLVEQGYRVLFINLDTQENSSKTLTDATTDPDKAKWQATRAGDAGDILFRATPPDDITLEAFTIFTASASLSLLDTTTFGYLSENLNLLSPHIDYCIIDTPPAFGIETAAALAITHYLIAPLELSEMGLDSLYALMAAKEEMDQYREEPIHFLGGLINKFDNKPSQTQILNFIMDSEELRSALIKGVIKNRQGYADAFTQRTPVWTGTKTAERDAGNEIKRAFAEIMTLIDTTENSNG